MEAGLLPVPKKPPKGFKTDVTKLRLGGGQVWQDHSLEDWDPSESTPTIHTQSNLHAAKQSIPTLANASTTCMEHVVKH